MGSGPTGEAITPRAAFGARGARRGRVQWSAYLYLLPALVILAAFHIFPVFYAVYISLQRGPIGRMVYNGLQNYARALSSGDFWHALGTTFVYALLTMPITIILGLIFAYLLYQGVRGQGAYRTAYFMPYVVSTVGSAIVWAWIFDPASGLANAILQRLGLPPLRWLIEPAGIGQVLARSLHLSLPGWAAGPSVALLAVAIFSIWQAAGYDVIIFLAGLTNIPGEMYEAARIDGANGWQLLRYITIPLLAPTTFFVIVISVIASLQSFNQIFAMNRAAAQELGGPLGSTSTLTVYMFNQLYTFADYGYAAAVALLLSLIILGLTLFNFRVLGGRGEG